MDDKQLELVLIGANPVARPFYNDYTPEYLAKIRTVNHDWALRFSWQPNRPLLVEEVYSSYNDLEERTRELRHKATA